MVGNREPVSYDPKTGLYHCDVCGHAKNSSVDLTDMRKEGTSGSMRICSSRGCWERAEELGYLSST
ncbi:hypothetical protein EV383_6260 [Pseudonocardia sediminis]|uniref:Uncharacterized protein n=1 Tax=Pseudonocardia sediminis TaxID=1397368 RepID=A0A4Q7U7J5_PSEST|nr:hypothetical protein EV383_6260 [Pseudonocardia sediminis]